MMNVTDDRTLCCSNNCKKRFECAIHYLNSEGECIVEDYSNYGSGVISSKECKVEYWCGELGDYKMFEPVKKRGLRSSAPIIDDLCDIDASEVLESIRCDLEK